MSSKLKAALILAVSVFLLFSCELILRRRLGGDPDKMDRLFQNEVLYLDAESKVPFFKRDGADWVTARPRALPQRFPAAKAEGELRVFVAGESVALRLGTRPLEDALGRDFPDRRVRVINCGMGSYDSSRTAAVLMELQAYGPDLFVVLVGNNDGRSQAGGSALLARLNIALRELWTWRLAQDAVARALAPSRSERRARVERRFARNLESMAEGAKAAGVPLVLCTLPVNARDYPPLGALPSSDGDFSWGWASFERGHFSGAVAGFREFSGRNPDDAMVHYWLARAREKIKDPAGARWEYRKALERDFPDRCTPSRNETIRGVAREQGAALADLERLFERLSPGGPPGWALFDDGVHFRERTYPAVASAIASSASGRKAGAPASIDTSWQAGPELEGVALDALSQAVQAGLQDPPVILERAVAELILVERHDPALIKHLTQRPEALATALSDNDWARPVAAAVPAGWESVVRHVDEAERRRLQWRK